MIEAMVPCRLSADGSSSYPYKSAYAQRLRLYKAADLPDGVMLHSLRQSYATEALRLGAAPRVTDVADLW